MFCKFNNGGASEEYEPCGDSRCLCVWCLRKNALWNLCFKRSSYCAHIDWMCCAGELFQELLKKRHKDCFFNNRFSMMGIIATEMMEGLGDIYMAVSYLNIEDQSYEKMLFETVKGSRCSSSIASFKLFLCYYKLQLVLNFVARYCYSYKS